MVTKEEILKLREETGMGMLDCKKALEHCEGDFEKAKAYLIERWEFTKKYCFVTDMIRRK